MEAYPCHLVLKLSEGCTNILDCCRRSEGALAAAVHSVGCYRRRLSSPTATGAGEFFVGNSRTCTGSTGDKVS